MSFEDQLQRITDKAKLHKLIDELGEDASALIITEEPIPGDTGMRHRYTAYGDLSVTQAYWLAGSAQHYFMTWARYDED